MKIIRDSHEVTARKQHTCSWCSNRITPGERYKTSTRFMDYIYEWRECGRCAPFVQEMFETASWEDIYITYGFLTENDFKDFMWDEHPKIAKEWW